MSHRRGSAVAVVCLLAFLAAGAWGSEAQEKAQKAFDALYGADVKRALASRDTVQAVALGAKLLDSAKAAEDQPELMALLCAKACELGATDPQGYETVQAAADLAADKAPEAAGPCQETLAAIRQRQYDAARGGTKAEAGEALIDALLALAATHTRAGEVEEAGRPLHKALSVARAVKSPKVDAVDAQLKANLDRQKSAAELARLKRQVEADPANAKARDQLVTLLVVDYDDPAEAARYLAEASDATLRKFVPAAVKPVTDAPELACLGLMDWYVALAATAGPGGKAAMHARAVQYGERFLGLHEAKDLDRTRAELTLKRARDEIARSGGEANDKGRWIDVLKGIDLAGGRVGGGQWQKTPEGLLLTGANRSRMVLPAIPEGSYEFEFRFVRMRGTEIDALLPVGARAAALVIHGFGGPISALSLVRGREISDEAVFRNTQIVNGRPSVVKVRVLLDKDDAQVAVAMDGKTIFAWKGPQSALSSPPWWALPNPRCLGIGGMSSDVLFQAARLRMLSGKAVPLRPAGAGPASPSAK